MIWLASYPRSGNTYFRIILESVFGILSGEFGEGVHKKMQKTYQNFPIVKTHKLPHQLIPSDESIPAICLIRDGRDALVSRAHRYKYLVDPESDYFENLERVICSSDGSDFGGWSENVRQWIKRSQIVLRYEDLVKSPVDTVAKISKIIELPKPQIDNLPTFQYLKNSQEKSLTKSVVLGLRKFPDRRKMFFRRGVVGSWKDEMPEYLHKLYWEHHGDMMRNLGYTDGMIE